MESLSFLAHDIRNIAAAISLDAERMSLSTVKAQKEHGLRTLQRLDRMVAICEEAMKANRTQNKNNIITLPSKDICLADLLSDVIDGLPQVPNVQNIDLDCDQSLRAAICETRLYRLIYNLAVNAIYAMEDQDDARLSISVSRLSKHIQFDVIDNGPGLPKDIFSSFNRPFIVNNQRSSVHGFGLSLVKRMASEMNGSLWIVKSDSQGTHFRIVIPVSPQNTDVPLSNNTSRSAFNNMDRPYLRLVKT